MTDKQTFTRDCICSEAYDVGPEMCRAKEHRATHADATLNDSKPKSFRELAREIAAYKRSLDVPELEDFAKGVVIEAQRALAEAIMRMVADELAAWLPVHDAHIRTEARLEGEIIGRKQWVDNLEAAAEVAKRELAVLESAAQPDAPRPSGDAILDSARPAMK